MADQGRPFPRYVRREFDEYLKCGLLEYGFLRLRCDTCHAERLLAFSCKRRALVTPGKRGKGRKISRKIRASDDTQDKSPEARRGSMNWAQRIKRVFNIDVERCDQCGGKIKEIACIEDPVVIKKILDHLDKTAPTEQGRRPQRRASPQGSLLNGSPG